MRQVPSYLIIGNGRVARHFKHYFTLLNLNFNCWNRTQSIDLLHHHLQSATHVLLLISDQAIEPFIAQYLKSHALILIHFSGALVSDVAYGLHPLMTFSHYLYEQEAYEAVPFVIDDDAPAFENLLPGLPNQSVRLGKSLKVKYHALCVLSGNFSAILWDKLFSSLENEFNVPRAIAFPYLLQQTKNLLTDSAAALTGPLMRRDRMTLNKNLVALDKDAFKTIYKSFVQVYEQMTKVELL